MTNEKTTTFAELGLRDDILRAVTEAGYAHPTTIQARAIPEVIAGRDVLGIAQTGTGKTASFTLPMLHILAAGKARARMPRSLILSPTRELATQTSANFETYGKYLNLSMALLIGGVGMGEQEKALEKGVDVLIATPGRLLDWFERGKILLGGVNIMVIDEADRMLDMGFIPDVERIIQLMAMRRQTLLFSATMPKEIKRLADKFLKDPVEIEVARPAQTTALIKDVLVPLQRATDKREALERLMTTENITNAIIFCNRKRDIGGLTRFLKSNGIKAGDIHGDLEQSHRDATLSAFRKGEIDMLVATDVAARGLDINDMPVVINFDVPIHADDYVHRIGRTGRAGKEGRAFSFATKMDSKFITAIERVTGRTLERYELSLKSEPAPATKKVAAKPVEVAEQVEEAVPAELSDAQVAMAAEPAVEQPPARKRRSTRSKRPSEPKTAEIAAATETKSSEVKSSETKSSETTRSMRGDQGTRRRSDSRRRDSRDETVIVGMGDHTPAFMLRPVPAKLLAG